MKNLLYILFLFSTQFAFAQSELPEGFGDYRTIENPEFGRDYAQVYMPELLKEKIMFDSVVLLRHNQQVISKLKLGKDYEIETKIIEIKPATIDYNFEIVNDTTLVNSTTIIKSKLEKITPMPRFENQIITEEQLILPEQKIPFYYKYPKRKYSCFDFIEGRKDVEIIGFVWWNIYPKYSKIKKRIFQKDGQWWAETLADTIILNNEIAFINSQLVNNVEHILPVLDTFKILHLKEIPSNIHYSTISKKVIIQNAFFSEWVDAFCQVCGSSRWSISELQKSLKGKGYDVEVTDSFDEKTKVALVQFQKENGLSVGSLDDETFKALGIKHY